MQMKTPAAGGGAAGVLLCFQSWEEPETDLADLNWEERPAKCWRSLNRVLRV